ncbi:MAG: hypothetical protein HY835_13695 [Anaerolineae bacterium]|nr:hypothetical protein [Anaerolineae bacterium]
MKLPLQRIVPLLLLVALLVSACSSAPATEQTNLEPTQPKEASVDQPANNAAYPAAESQQGTEAESAYPSGEVPPAAGNNYPAPYSADTRTGIALLDQIITAMQAGNSQELAGLIIFEQAPCTTGDGLGGPPKCREGEADANVIEVLPMLGSEGSFIRKGEVPADFLTGGYQLFAAYEVKADIVAEEYYPAGRWGLVFIQPSGASSITLRLNENGIVRVDYDFDRPGESFRDAGEYLLPPK